MIDINFVRTSDDLRLQGVEYYPAQKDVCVLMVHGMSGNFLENYFASILGDMLARNGIGFIYGHNRGYNHVNDIATSEIKPEGGYVTRRIGAKYERFTECLYDISVWVKKCSELGYKRIVLMGHSLGCNKVIYYFSQKRPKEVVGIILASPPDMIGLIRKHEYQSNFDDLYKEAVENVKNNEPRKVLSGMIWDWYHLSSQTFLDLFAKDSPANNLPVMRNPDKWEQFAVINIPTLGIMGEKDDIAIKTLQKDLDLIASKAISCPSFVKKFIHKAGHTYDACEKDFAKVVLDWVKRF